MFCVMLLISLSVYPYFLSITQLVILKRLETANSRANEKVQISPINHHSNLQPYDITLYPPNPSAVSCGTRQQSIVV